MVSISGIAAVFFSWARGIAVRVGLEVMGVDVALVVVCLLYTSDAADE